MVLVNNINKNIASGLGKNCTYKKDYSDYMKEIYQSKVNSSFEFASSLNDIDEELTFGTQIFTDTKARINHIVQSGTGSKLGDDFRELKFEDFTHAKGLGFRYRFDNNIWLTINTDLYRYVTSSTIIRRCNNVMKWKDNNGVLRQEPCVIDYMYSGTQVDFDQAINIPSGNLVVTAQYNDFTKNIKINDRFIFGSQAFKVKSLNDFFQNQTGLNSTTPLLYLNVYKDSIAEGDDLINGIPVSNLNYTISLDTVTINQSVGYTTQLIATVKRNNEIYSTPITWTSSNTSIATVDSNGNVSLIADGSCIISASMTDNTGVIANCNVTVQAVPTNIREVRITPNVTELLQGTSQQYFAYLYIDGVQQSDVVTFGYSGATSDKYLISNVGNNTFTLKNVKMSSVPLTITGTSGVMSGNIVVKLKGSF